MKNIQVVVLCLVVTVMIGAISAYVDVEESAGAESELPVSVHLKRTEPRTLATMRHSGSFNDIPQVIGDLMARIVKGDHLVAGPTMIIYYNDPRQVPEAELLWEVWVPVARPGKFGSTENDEMGFKYLDAMFVAYTYHIGPYETVGDSYDRLFAWAGRNKYEMVGPPVEVYWSDNEQTPQEKLVTEIWLPVDEKKIPGGVVK